MNQRVFIFECSTATYFDCVQKSLFRSNLPWLLQVKAGHYCCLYHYEVETMFALWQATTDDGRNLVPKAWAGRFPFQARVALATPEIIEIPKARIPETFINPTTEKLNSALEGQTAERLLRSFMLARSDTANKVDKQTH